MNDKFRLEHDSVGELEVPADAYYGVQSLRGVRNFKITGMGLHPNFIKNMAKIKKACAIVNGNIGAFDTKIADAIVKASDEIIDGALLIYLRRYPGRCRHNSKHERQRGYCQSRNRASRRYQG